MDFTVVVAVNPAVFWCSENIFRTKNI